MSELAGRTALVTGATAGIGRAVAKLLAQHGAEVVAHGRDPQRGAALVDAIRADGGTARFVAADLGDTQDVERLAREAGAVDILINNAVIYELTPTLETTAESVDRQLAVNTRAPFQLVAALVPHMIERGAGTIVNISSTVATTVAPVGAASGASKAALELLTRYWATEFGAAGIRVNGVARAGAHPRDGVDARDHRGRHGQHDGTGADRGPCRDRRGRAVPRPVGQQLRQRHDRRRPWR